jgi:hypothetical protein
MGYTLIYDQVYHPGCFNILRVGVALSVIAGNIRHGRPGRHAETASPQTVLRGG